MRLANTLAVGPRPPPWRLGDRRPGPRRHHTFGACTRTSARSRRSSSTEGRLRARSELRRQTVAGAGPLAGCCLRFIPVEHAGNTNASAEEAECVAGLIRELLDAGAAWVDMQGVQRRLTPDHILVVAPYNAHVAVLRATLPTGARVGTVDKFHGQEALIVIYSMATSTADEAPRGMEFLLQPAPPQRRHLARPLRGRDRRQPRSPHAGLPHPGADAPRQSLLPLPRAGAASSGTPDAQMSQSAPAVLTAVSYASIVQWRLKIALATSPGDLSRPAASASRCS